MYISHSTIKVSDLRKHATEVLDEISEREEPVIVFSRSEPKVIMMSCQVYESLKGSSPPKDNRKERHGLGFFANPPEEMLIKRRGIDAVKEVRKLRS